jgi:MtN3 and saliva related transmembrane protein
MARPQIPGEHILDWKQLLGMVGGALTSLSLVPQIWQLFRLKSAREISLPFSLCLLLGIACWLVYGILFDLFPVIMWNAISLVLSAIVLYAKLKYGRNDGTQPGNGIRS